MEKVPFTNDGIEQKRQELYTLSEDYLRDQLQLMQTDSKNWAKENFDFSVDQENLIDEFPDDVFAQFGLQFAIAMDYRLDVVVEKADSAIERKLCEGGQTKFEGRAGWLQGGPATTQKLQLTFIIPE